VTHEVFHCFQARDYPAAKDVANAPRWLIEGEAEWVAESLAPDGETESWSGYLKQIQTPLTSREYDAIGFFAHMQETGLDPWLKMDTLLKAGSSSAAFALVAVPGFLNSWASSLARQSAFGAPWNATGPGIPEGISYRPTVEMMPPGRLLEGTVKAYSNMLVEFESSADVVSVQVTNPYGRLHDSKNVDLMLLKPQRFCLKNCGKCQERAEMTTLAPGPVWLAATGDMTGSTYKIAALNGACLPCLVGSWMTTRTELQANTMAPIVGGGGAEVDIEPDGATRIAMGGGSLNFVSLAGAETMTLGFAPDMSASSGSIRVLTPDDSGVTATVHGNPVQGQGGTTAQIISCDFTCTPDGLVLKFSSQAAARRGGMRTSTTTLWMVRKK
jgi:hypothetical protein